MNSETAQLLVHRHYDDIGEWGGEVGWDFACQQAEPGQMSAFAAAVGTSRCIVTRGEFSRSFRQTGSPPRGMVTLGFPDQEVTEFDWCGKQARGGDIVNFSLANGFAGTTPTGFAGFAISISEELMNETADDLQIEAGSLQVIGKKSVWGNAHSATRMLRLQFSIDLGNARGRGGENARKVFSQKTASLILQLISAKHADGKTDSLAARGRATRRALEYIEGSNTAALSIVELCKHAGVSAPTLYRGFEERFGTGPKRFILIHCLSGVRKELLTACANLSVSDIANHWGFWHMGQFAAEYRKCFGELPSQTRCRSSATD